MYSGNAHVIEAFNDNYVGLSLSRNDDALIFFQGITSNQKWTLALSIFYVGYCEFRISFCGWRHLTDLRFA